MTTTTGLSEAAERLIPVLEALPAADRAELARRLVAGLDGPEEDPATARAAWVAVLRRGVEEVEQGKVAPVPMEEMFRRSREKYP